MLQVPEPPAAGRESELVFIVVEILLVGSSSEPASRSPSSSHSKVLWTQSVNYQNFYRLVVIKQKR
jgi:hypothetical protein